MFTVTPRKSGENNKSYSYRILRDAIMYLELKPGQALSEVEFSYALNISRTPNSRSINSIEGRTFN